MKIIQDNAKTKVIFEEPDGVKEKVANYLYEHMAVDIPGAQFSPQVRRGIWDGKTHFYDKKDNSFATGLTSQVTSLLDNIRFDYEFGYEVIDNRPDRIVDASTIPDEISVNASDGVYNLRDYQVDAVKAVFKTGSGGIVNGSVGSGKTLVGASVIREILPKLERGERVGFFTNNSEIFRQSVDNLSKFIPEEKIGYLGNGKQKLSRIMVCMIPTVDSYLKIDPEAKLSLTPKEQQVKKIATKYREQFMNAPHPYSAFRSFSSLYKPIKKVDVKTKEVLEEIRDTTGSDQELIRALNEYKDKYDAIINKKAGDLVKKKKFIDDLLDSFVLIVADECVTGDTIIGNSELGIPARKVAQGDKLGGSTIKHVSTTDCQPVYELVAGVYHVKGSITHPIAVWSPDKDDHIVYKPMVKIKHTDYVIVPGEHIGLSRVDYVKPTGKCEPLYDIETDTHTYIGNGILMHNCHHTKADTWYKVLLSCRNAIYKVGLSGSIDRDDELIMTRLKGVFGEIVNVVKTKDLVDRGILAKPTVIMIPISEPSGMKSMSSARGQWQKVYQLGIVDNKYRNTVIAQLAKRQYDLGKTILIIVNQINQSNNISKILDAYKVPHEFIYGEQDSDTRKEELNRVKDSSNRVLLATSVLDEGVDISNIDTLIMAAGGKSTRQIIQRVGRVLRKKKTGENKATIFDFIDDTNYVLRGHSETRIKLYEEQQYELKFLGKKD